MQRIMLSACAAMLMLSGCQSDPLRPRPSLEVTRPDSARHPEHPIASRAHRPSQTPAPTLGTDASPDAYVRAALFNSPELEAAYQRWVAQSQRIAQVGALPDPRLSVGFFANEVETRVGAQQARLGLSQTLPWLGALRAREDAAGAQAQAAWVEYKATELSITRRVVSAIYALHDLDRSVEISSENLELLRSFEDSVRSRYRVGAGSHPDLIRTQVELGLMDDRVRSLIASRPMLVAQLNALLDRPHDSPIELPRDIPVPVIETSLDALIAQANSANPELLALGERMRAQQSLTESARYAGKPELTVGIETIFTDQAINPSIPESGDDPLLLSFSMNIPIWREKYDAQVRESIAQRLALANTRAQAQNNLSARISAAYFDYSDALRRSTLYEQTLIPKATESLQSTLAAFRTGSSGFTDLLDAQRVLLEFELSAQHARTAQGIAAAKLNELAGVSESAVEPSQTEPEITP